MCVRQRMKKALVILGICCFLNITKTNCQMSKNAYELEMDRLLAEKSPDYHSGLKKTLSEFQQELITKGLIENDSYESYLELLKKISKDDKFNFDIDYDLKERLGELGEGITNIIPSIESSSIAQNYLNIENSKNYIFDQKISILVNNGEELNRSKFANLIMEVFDQNDFKLPLIRLKMFRFIDPKSDFVVYIYAGKPNPE